MPALLPGYSYDIFISYRQKDNHALVDGRQPGWVTDFVAHLRAELQSTIKEDVTVYFDGNQYDGILETHDVYDSLKDKLKCLIFVPVLSKTYCDTRSFAWQHEFLVFKNLSETDALGAKVRLANGNVSSRIIPVCIHDLDPADRTLLEKEVGPLRFIDFTFRSPGVSRPLTPFDRREDNASRTFYKDQLNKLALSLKEVLNAMTADGSSALRDAGPHMTSAVRRNPGTRLPWVFGVILFLAAVAAIFFFRTDPIGTFDDKSIAILPFVDMSAAKDLEYLGDGISEEIINALTAISDLRIIGRTSSFQFKGEKLDLREVGARLGVASVLEGSVQRSGDRLRITANLIRAKDNTQVWSEHYDVQHTDLFKIQENIAGHILEKLNLTLSAQDAMRMVKKETTPEAYNLFLKGLFQYKQERNEDALIFMSKVLALDSQYAPAYAYTALSKAWIIIRNRNTTDVIKTREAIHFSERSIQLDPQLPEGYSSRALIAWAIERDFRKARTYFEKSIDLNPSSSLIKNRYAFFLTWMGEFDEAMRLAKEAMQSDPVDYNCYANLYNASLYNDRFEEANFYQREWKRIFGENRSSLTRDIQLGFYENSLDRVLQLCDSAQRKDTPLNPTELSYAAMASAGVQRAKEAKPFEAALSALRSDDTDGSFYGMACLFAYRKQYDSCISNLRRSIERRESRINQLKIEPVFRALKGRPDFAELYSMSGFDRY